MSNEQLYVKVVEGMRSAAISEDMQDGFWMGLQAALHHPEWARAVYASMELRASEDAVAQAMIAETMQAMNAVINNYPLESS